MQFRTYSLVTLGSALLLAACDQPTSGGAPEAETGTITESTGNANGMSAAATNASADAGADTTPAEPIAVGKPSPLDQDGCADHPALSRYPETILAWCSIENYLPFRIPLGPVTGYRAIAEWEDTAGRVTRNFYVYEGEDRTHSEVYLNYSKALKTAGFEILGEGLFPAQNLKRDIGGRSWQEVYYRTNPWKGPGAVNTLAAGTASSGGSASIIARKKRVDGTLWVVGMIEQHSSTYIGVLLDFIETKDAETGLVMANAEAMGKDIAEYGRTVIAGLMFDHDKASLKAESKPALDEAAKLLKTMAGKSFYVVGHTDSAGSYAYNTKLSGGRAASVRQALIDGYGVKPDRLQAIGVGPVSPVFTNGSDGGKEKNRRVELVEQ